MNADVRTVAFAVAVGAVCSLLLVATTQLTAPYREANARAEEVRNLLGAVGAPLDPQAEPAALLEVYDRDVREKKAGDLVLYEYTPGGSAGPEAVAVPLAGMGLWGPVKGVMALEPDLVTIRSVRFYQQEETPGLGGEIGSERFQGQFRGKRIVSDAGKPGFRILKPGSGDGADSNSVDGITGATMTSARVAKILDDASRAIERQRATYGH
jgi:Na+-transporting NADH:ubiquinone oxidoreductase subunit C